VSFKANNPVWTGGAGRNVDTTMNFTADAGYTITKVEIAVYRVLGDE
jgi:nitrogenase subunit NifH